MVPETSAPTRHDAPISEPTAARAAFVFADIAGHTAPTGAHGDEAAATDNFAREPERLVTRP